MLRQQLILEFAAHGHNLLEQFFDAMAVKGIVGQGLHGPQLFFLSGSVKYFFACMYLISCHLT